MNIFTHNILYLVLLVCAFQHNLFSQNLNVTDSISLNWTRLDGPPAFVSKYAEGGGKVYAASEEMLFSSSDGGLHWEPNLALGRKRIKQLFANDYTVVVITEELRIIDPSHPFSFIEIHQMFRSLDRGLSWDKVMVFYLEPETPIYNRAYDFFSPNDSTIVFEYLQSKIFPEFAETQLWISKDYGTTWFNPPGRIQLYHVIKDTASYIRPINNVFHGFVSRYDDLSNAQQIDLSETNATATDILLTAYTKGTFHLFIKNKTLWSTFDQGVSWNSVQLPFPGELNKVVWHDSLFYAVASTGVYQFSVDEINGIIKVYDGQHGRTVMPHTFMPTHSGFWVNTDVNQTAFSLDNGLNWNVRSAGLSSKVGFPGAVCHRAYARSLGPTTMLGGWYQAEVTGSDWAYLPTIFFYNAAQPWTDLKEAGGYSYRYLPATVQRSSDCGVSWEDLPIDVLAQPKGVYLHNGRLIIFYASNPQTLISEDNGITWEGGTLPGSGILSMAHLGNTLIAAYPDKIYLSDDLGDTWEMREMPNTMRAFYVNGPNLVAIHHTGEYEAMIIYRSPDLGATWETTLELPVAMSGNRFKRQFAVGGGLLLLEDNGFPYASANDGESWAKLLDVPYSRRINNFSLGLFDDFDPLASAYSIRNGQVYAASEADGLWAIPTDSILSALATTPSKADIVVPDNDSWQISPNPTTQIIWVSYNGAFSKGSQSGIRFRILDLTGRTRMEHDGPPNLTEQRHRLDLLGLPSGAYFLEIMEKNSRTVKRFLKL